MPASALLDAARGMVVTRVASLQQQLAALDASQAGETKSSAGDKFETSREMMQQERDRLEAQLAVMLGHARALDAAERRPPSEIVGLGSALRLSNGQAILLATGYGKLREGPHAGAVCISLESPLGKALAGKRVGDAILLAGTPHRVAELLHDA